MGGRELWQPIQTAVIKAELPVHTFVADLVHLSKLRLPAVVIGLLYKLLWGAAVLVDIDDGELCFVGEREPITLDGLKRRWTRLAVDLAQWFEGITTA